MESKIFMSFVFNLVFILAIPMKVLCMECEEVLDTVVTVTDDAGFICDHSWDEANGPQTTGNVTECPENMNPDPLITEWVENGEIEGSEGELSDGGCVIQRIDTYTYHEVVQPECTCLLLNQTLEESRLQLGISPNTATRRSGWEIMSEKDFWFPRDSSALACNFDGEIGYAQTVRPWSQYLLLWPYSMFPEDPNSWGRVRYGRPLELNFYLSCPSNI